MSHDLEGWVPSPRHLLRVACIADVTAAWTPGPVLEVGAGTGDVTARFVERGFDVIAHDLGERSRSILRDRFDGAARVVDHLDEVEPGSVEFLFAFEVLEHVEDDLGVLKTWLSKLRPGGTVLVSVPAHQRKFGDADRAVGHVRRYEREQLIALLTDAGLVSVEVHNYGFPLGNVLRWAQTAMRVVGRRRASEADDDEERIRRTVDSGVQTVEPLNRMRRVLRPGTLRPFAALQRVAYRRDWSDGYVATARLPEG